VRFVATDDPPPESSVKLPRPSREGEPLFDYLCAVAKAKQVIAHDASLTSAKKRQIGEELLHRAAEDELFGGSIVGRTLLAADEEWRRKNPEIAAELGRMGGVSRDLLGRSVRGPARAVAVLPESLTEDPGATWRTSSTLSSHPLDARTGARPSTRREGCKALVRCSGPRAITFARGERHAAPSRTSQPDDAVGASNGLLPSQVLRPGVGRL
jgi:hypothetical protein